MSNVINDVMMVIGYVVAICMLAFAIGGVIMGIKDKIKARKENDIQESLAKFNVRFAELRSEVSCETDGLRDQIGELTARCSAIESIVDQFRPAPGYELDRPQREGEAV